MAKWEKRRPSLGERGWIYVEVKGDIHVIHSIQSSVVATRLKMQNRMQRWSIIDHFLPPPSSNMLKIGEGGEKNVVQAVL